MPEQARGTFVVFEGLDGSGLTEQVELLRDWLRRTGYALNRVAFTHEPSSGPVGLVLRLVLQGRLNLDEETIALLFAADRRDHVKGFIEPRLEKGIHVVSDRYYLSFYAYQAAQGLPLDWLRTVGKAWIQPDLTIVLDTPLEQCLKYIERRFERERYEQEETLRNTWGQFKRVIQVFGKEGQNIEVVDGAGEFKQVHRRILPLIEPILNWENQDGG